LPKYCFIFFFHSYVYDPESIRPKRLGLKRGALQQYLSHFSRGIRDSVFSSMFSQWCFQLLFYYSRIIFF
jgi:hypothetical protein